MSDVSTKNVVISEKARKIFDDMDWNSVEAAIRSNSVSVKNTAASMGVSQAEFRQELINRYGDRIVFVRGRNGGARFVEGK